MSEYTAVLDAIRALSRGVQEPTIVYDFDDEEFDYVPGAYLTDASYTGPRTPVYVIDEESFGPDFNVEDPAAWEEAAAWAAEEWNWVVEEE